MSIECLLWNCEIVVLDLTQFDNRFNRICDNDDEDAMKWTLKKLSIVIVIVIVMLDDEWRDDKMGEIINQSYKIQYNE